MKRGSINLNFQRVYSAPRELVFRALTEPALISRWFFPRTDVTLTIDRYELQVGRSYRFVYSFADGTNAGVTGKFIEIAPPSRLVFTWTWEPPDPHAGIETVVTFDVTELNDSTELTVVHERLPEEYGDAFQKGWPQTLLHLDCVLSEDVSSEPR